MTDDDLERVFGASAVPVLDDAARDRIVSSAVIRYRHAANDSAPAPSPGNWLGSAFKPVTAGVAALVIVVLAQNVLPPMGGSSDVDGDRYNAALFEEYRTLFQEELRAVVAHGGGVDVVLGGQSSVRINPVVVICLKADGAPMTITAYSGQTIEAVIGGKTVSLDILTTPDNDVMVASADFVLERGLLHGPDFYQADAHVLETSL